MEERDFYSIPTARRRELRVPSQGPAPARISRPPWSSVRSPGSLEYINRDHREAQRV